MCTTSERSRLLVRFDAVSSSQGLFLLQRGRGTGRSAVSTSGKVFPGMTTVLITGARWGVGLTLARQCAGDGAHVIAFCWNLLVSKSVQAGAHSAEFLRPLGRISRSSRLDSPSN